VDYSYTNKGYRLQNSGSTILFDANPQIYLGTWDGTFTYSWTQNPVWILYDILTNTTYGLGVPEGHIDKYKFYQVGMYCDACDPITGRFIGVDAIADGSFRYKPLDTYDLSRNPNRPSRNTRTKEGVSSVRENQIGLQSGTPVKNVGLY